MPDSSIYANAALYDEQYETYRDDLPHYLRLAEKYGSPILELGAGTGRLTAPLARAGHHVTAVEVSEAMLERARERLGQEGLLDRVELVRADMREVELGSRFPLVIAAFNTLMHLHTLGDQDRALSRAAQHLERGGAFAFDLYNPRLGQQGVLRREAHWGRVGGESSELFLVQDHDPLAQVVLSRYYLDTVDENGYLRRRTETLRQRYYTRFEIERALLFAGFRRVAFQGDFSGRPLEEDSPYLVGTALL